MGEGYLRMITFLGTSRTLNLYSSIIAGSMEDKQDIIVSCQYPFLVPASIIKKNIVVNIHYGDLPRYAGCNPVYWQVLEGNHAGVTLHYMDANFDSGPIIEKRIIEIGDMTADEVYDRLELLGFEMFSDNYRKILSGRTRKIKQDLSLRRYKNKRDIDFSQAKYIDKLDDHAIRALTFAGKQYPIIKVGSRAYELKAL